MTEMMRCMSDTHKLHLTHTLAHCDTKTLQTCFYIQGNQLRDTSMLVSSQDSQCYVLPHCNLIEALLHFDEPVRVPERKGEG